MLHLSTRGSRLALGAVIAVSVVLAGSRCSTTETSRDAAAPSVGDSRDSAAIVTPDHEPVMLDDGLLNDEPVGGEVEFDGATSDGSEQF
jgi:hypothetical protein